MFTLASNFNTQMEHVRSFLRLLAATEDLAKADLKSFRSTHAVARAARTVHAERKRLLATSFAYDGLFLIVCATYEMCVRDLVERFVADAAGKIQLYHHLPEAMRSWNAVGSAQLLIRIDEGQESMQHLTSDQVLRNLASCSNSSLAKPYALTPDCYSYNDHNLRCTVVEEMLARRLGLKKVWQKMARRVEVTSVLGTTNPSTSENVLRKRIDGYILRRNQIVHRGKGYYIASASEVEQATSFFGSVVEALANVLTDYEQSL